MASSFSHSQLVARQRAEFDLAAKLQRRSLRIQAGLALLGGLSVLLTQPLVSYVLAVMSFLLALSWTYTAIEARRVRGQAERARRATLLIDGLGSRIAPSEMRTLWIGFSATERAAQAREDDAYYDAREDAGVARVVEMLEETSFWSCHLMQASAKAMWIWFVFSVVLAIALALAAVQIADTTIGQSIARLVCLLLTFVVSFEILGAALAYQSSGQDLSKFGARIEAVRATDYSLPDVLMLLFDYNAAVEGAPMFVPGIYDRKKDELNALWHSRHDL